MFETPSVILSEALSIIILGRIHHPFAPKTPDRIWAAEMAACRTPHEIRSLKPRLDCGRPNLRVRLITHHDVSAADVEFAGRGVREVLSKG